MKIAIVNIIETVNGTVSSVVSFPITDEKDRDRVVKNAEKLFADKAKENGAHEDDIDSHIEDGNYSQQDYEVSIHWSEIRGV